MIETRFKETEIGMIPEDWEVKTVGDAFDILRNNCLSRDCLNYSEGDFYNVHYGDVLINFPEYTDLDVERLPFINRNCSFNKSLLQNGDVVMADTAEDETAGKVTEIFGVGENKVVSGLHTIPMRPRFQFAPKWLGYSMNSSLYHNQLLPLMCGTKVSSVSKSSILETKIAYPKDIKEQSAIADALSDVDGLLRELDAVIAKKRAIKQGMMQELLTVEAVPGKEGAFRPKRRLEGFEGDWVEKRLGEIIDVEKGQQINGSKLVDDISLFPMMNGGQTASGFYSDYNCEKNTIIISEGGNSCGFVNYMICNFWAGGHCYVVKSLQKIENVFLYYVLKFNETKLMSLRVGSGLPNIQRKNVLDFVISISKNEAEQTAIAEVLSDMDAEIAALEAKRAKYEQVKNGMMQELLTGRIRLV